MGHNAESVLPKRKNLGQAEKWWHYLLLVCKAEICKSKAEKVERGTHTRTGKVGMECRSVGGHDF